MDCEKIFQNKQNDGFLPQIISKPKIQKIPIYNPTIKTPHVPMMSLRQNFTSSNYSNSHRHFNYGYKPINVQSRQPQKYFEVKPLLNDEMYQTGHFGYEPETEDEVKDHNNENITSAPVQNISTQKVVKPRESGNNVNQPDRKSVA